jgi:FkbM family methyltransferase
VTFDVHRTFKVISVGHAGQDRPPKRHDSAPNGAPIGPDRRAGVAAARVGGNWSGSGPVVGAIVARVRDRAKEAAARLGLMPQARRLQRLLGSKTTRRDLRDNEHLRLLLAFVLRVDANCIDVGANVGEILEEIVRVAPRGRHIAYEPLPDHAADLAKRFPDVDVREAALSNSEGQVSFQHVHSRPAMSGLRRRDYPGDEQIEEITVRTERLDSALPADYVPSLIKVDVEGAEHQVIEGAIETIRRHQPIVAFEHGRGAASHYGTGPSQIFELLCGEAGLRIFDLDGTGPYSQADLARTFDDGAYWNFIAHR